MKSGIISSFLLFVLTAYIVIPVVPIFDYLLHKDYIAKNLCVNRNKPKSCCKGKCYMVKQLKKTRANTEGESKNTEKKIQLKDTDQFLAIKTSQPIPQKNDFNYLIFNFSSLHLLAVNAIFVPPKTSTQPLV
ncbi:MAG: hypothetical protein Q7U54_04145 [Bacteroidales bacterium]|nr:hypothetical protein [Bacteroidales bacterium]